MLFRPEGVGLSRPEGVELSRPEGVRHLAAEVGVSRLMVGTDYPDPWTETAIDLIVKTPDPRVGRVGASPHFLSRHGEPAKPRGDGD